MEIFGLTKEEEVEAMQNELESHLKVVEQNLFMNISENFDFFSKAFSNFDEMKADLKTIEENAKLLREVNKDIKQD